MCKQTSVHPILHISFAEGISGHCQMGCCVGQFGLPTRHCQIHTDYRIFIRWLSWNSLVFFTDIVVRCRCIEWSDIKLHKIRSVALRSRRVMIVLDRLLIHQLESKSLYSISHISETRPTRNGRWNPWSSVVCLFEVPKCDGEKCCYCVLGYIVTLYVHSGNDQSHLAPYYER
jgi:hypothetical protein